jgi:hypothetical protein
VSSIRERIEGELSGWEGVEARPHRFGGVEFRFGGHEIGHLHGGTGGKGGWADLPFPKRVREGLVAEGKARPHHVLPETGWVSYPIDEEGDVGGALELFRLGYERFAARAGRRAGT